MKQEIISYLTTISNEMFQLSKYLYDNPETSFNEFKACKYITAILEKNKFNVTNNFLSIPTAFFAEYGSGHPKICYVCEYDAVENLGHITGHNLISSMSLAAALGVSKVIPKTGGTVIVIGCPGEFINGSKVVMSKEGVFDDIDIVLMAHPDIITAESGTSKAILPLSVKYKSNDGLAYRSTGHYSALDAALLTFNAINSLTKGFKKDFDINGVIVNGGSSPYLIPSETECKFYIRTSKMTDAVKIEEKIRKLIDTIGTIMEISFNISIYESPYDELITNKTLSRLFSHNLKEAGIIDILDSKDTLSGLSLGTVSHRVPCIHPYVSIIDDNVIDYSSKEFAMATISDFAQDKVMKTAQSLALTGLDIIENKALLSEIKNEFFAKRKETN
ncbi:MAG: amidohydrolase [Clostridiaceae bacterium]|nr:amidohydrolase [Clostridiaceae bacterium]